MGLNFELKSNNIDVMSYNPGEVATKGLLVVKEDAKGLCITTEKAATTCFRDLGYTEYTNGAFEHEIGAMFIRNLPKSTLN